MFHNMHTPQSIIIVVYHLFTLSEVNGSRHKNHETSSRLLNHTRHTPTHSCLKHDHSKEIQSR